MLSLEKARPQSTKLPLEHKADSSVTERLSFAEYRSGGVELEMSGAFVSYIGLVRGVLSTSLVLHRVFHSGFDVLLDCLASIRIHFC